MAMRIGYVPLHISKRSVAIVISDTTASQTLKYDPNYTPRYTVLNAADTKNKPSKEFVERRRDPHDRPLTVRDMKPYYQKVYANTPEDELPVGITPTGTRPVGYQNCFKEFIRVPEMIPEIVVPDLTDFKLKPYVSYRVTDIDMPEFTARDLYETTYAVEVKSQFHKGKLDKEVDDVIEKAKCNGLKQATYSQRPKIMYDTKREVVG